jgi:flavin reductase (DIM6/NTAB) family NADH-FMN oxidoreductase RutF
MHYNTRDNNHGMRHNPFKALVAPRPIGWISSVSPEGVLNLAPYSFFNAVSDAPPMIIYSSEGRKDSLRNIEASGEFTCSIVPQSLGDQMNITASAVDPQVDEFALAGLTPAPSVYVAPPRVAESPAALECKVWKMLDMPPPDGDEHSHWTVVFGIVVGVYIDDNFIKGGLVDTTAIRPIARLGYTDYTVVSPESMFQMKRPKVAADGRTVTADTQPWDGLYR